MAWQQQKDKPLFPDLLWSKPENKRSAGKLLLIGGQSGQFNYVAKAYESALKAGAGHIRVLMPDSLQKVTEHLPDIEYAPSNSSGSFSKKSLGMFYEVSEWADHVMLVGDFGENSQTVTILDGYLLRCPQLTTISNAALASIALPISQLAKRPITLALDEPLLAKLPLQFEISKAITSSMNIMEFADILQQMSQKSKANYIVLRQGKIWVATGGGVTSTDIRGAADLQELSAFCATWIMQQPAKPLQALTTACYEALNT